MISRHPNALALLDPRGPIATVALEDVEFDGEKFFGGDDREFFAAEDDIFAALEPVQ